MHRKYHRRAFVLLALLALEPAVASPARADGDSLWDLLSRTDQLSQTTTFPTYGGTPRAEIVRRPIGPVPGFTLPDSEAGPDGSNDDIFLKTKKKKHSIFGPVGDWLSNLESRTGSKIVARGHQTTSFRLESVSGSGQAYHDEQYYGQGNNGIYNDTELDVDATLFKYLHYQTQISNSPFHNPNDNRVKLDYNTKKMRLQWGDINSGFTGNSLIDFNRYMRGIEVSNSWSKQLRTTLLYSQTKAETRTIVIPGNGSSGPYYVYAGQIVDGSVHIRIDNRELQMGTDKDYTLDPYTGQLNFTKGNVVLPSSSIAVSFETLGFAGSTGNIYGARTEFSPAKGTNFGLTYIRQQSPGSGALQVRTEKSYGFGTPNFYSTNAPIDLSKPLIILVGDRQLAPNEYTVDRSFAYTNRVLITEAVPASVIVTISYYPYNPTPIAGNRSVIGLDGRTSLGKWGSLSLESAMSGINLSGSNIEGKAVQLRLDLTPLRKLHTTIALKDVGSAFSSIQSPGFNLNEKSITLNSEYEASKRLHLTLNWIKAKRPSYSGSFTGTTLATNGMDDYGEYGLSAIYNLGRNTTLNLTRSDLSTQYALGGNSKNLSDTLSLNWSRKSLSLDLSLSSNRSNILSSYNLLGLTTAATSTTPQYLSNSSSTLTKRINLQWQPLRWLSLGGSVSDNQIRSSGAGAFSSADARDTQLNATFKANSKLNLTYAFDLSDTGNLAASTIGTTLGTTGATTTGATTTGTGTILNPGRFAFLTNRIGPFAFGRDVIGGTTPVATVIPGGAFGTLGGGGINTGLGGLGNYSGLYGSNLINNYGASSFGGRSATHRLGIDYHPKQNMSFSMHIDRSSSLGDYQYNSNNNGLGVDWDWQFSSRLHIHTGYDVRNLAYTGSFGGSRSNTMIASLSGKPFGGKLDLQVNWQSLRTNSAFSLASATGTAATGALTNTSMALNSLNFRIEYPLSSRQTLFTEVLRSNSTGFYANTENDLRFGMDYNLTQALKFSLGWQVLSHNYQNTGSTLTNNSNLNYHVSSILAEFGFHF